MGIKKKKRQDTLSSTDNDALTTYVTLVEIQASHLGKRGDNDVSLKKNKMASQQEWIRTSNPSKSHCRRC